MKKIKFSILAILLLFILNSCGTVREGFQNPKKNTSDEFLVEKKSPLVVPPEFNELPIPKDNKNTIDTNDSSLKELFSDNEQNLEDSLSNKNLEENLLDKIKKN